MVIFEKVYTPRVGKCMIAFAGGVSFGFYHPFVTPLQYFFWNHGIGH